MVHGGHSIKTNITTARKWYTDRRRYKYGTDNIALGTEFVIESGTQYGKVAVTEFLQIQYIAKKYVDNTEDYKAALDERSVYKRTYLGSMFHTNVV